MVKMTQSLKQWLWTYHRDKIAWIMLGHTEMLTDDMWKEYLAWCQTDEGKQYLVGGSKYVEEGVTDGGRENV